ncbi:MAG: intradiol ring-cleavage dioxygenase [Paracoccus sp. (in: a-proteobacteria)]|uniref:intradiol ring-cleavage dioxygenase n=1 Tax=Paracoccus sp. TaxID=267 RepID=UPI0026DEE7D4|nr:intradiol ring-cleavage dioxygenase [Paracoccus sp. (in: a-proteobacteria)]MDO5613579.1 intradiol ring-cleavage dioxygenase [Paracoccus sp. (in: a-proteobacteria)]
MTHRRDLLKLLAAAAPAVLGAGSFPHALRAQAVQAGLITPNVCALMPEVTEGPYYIDPGLIRADIREQRPGLPLRMRLQVVDPACNPIPGARVDVWQCDAQGNYSGYARQGSDRVDDTTGQTFLRGTQIAGQDGVAAFQSIYPGWYRGRTAHVHFKVFLDQRNVLTGQMFFPDSFSDGVYAQFADYARDGRDRDVRNSNDGIARQAGDAAYAALTQIEGGYDAALVIGVSPDAVSRGRQGPRRGGQGVPPPPTRG